MGFGALPAPEGRTPVRLPYLGTTLCILVPPPPARANSFRVRFARPAGFHLVIDRALPPARADSADIRDNLVIDCAISALERI